MDRRSHRELVEDARLRRRELRRARRGSLRRCLARELPEQLAVSCLGGGQTRVEVAQLGRGEVRGEQREPLFAAQLDERRDEQPVEEPLGARLPDVRLQRLRVRIARVAPQPQAAAVEELQHLREVARLFASEPRHRARQPRDVRKRRQHRERLGRRLLLAMGVIDQHLVEAGDGQPDPGGRRLRQQLHGGVLSHGPEARRKKTRYSSNGMLVGIISDTHGLLRPEAAVALRGADHLLHAGDIGGEDVLEELGRIAPLTAVAGNVDGFRCGPARETARVELGGVRFYLTHILDRPQRPRPEVEEALRRDPADVVVFGHSHLPHDEVLSGVRFFNPASAGPRRFDYPVSVGMLELRGGRVVSSRFVPLDSRSEAALERHMNQLSRR